MFLLPIIVLVTIVGLYLFLLKKEKNKKSFRLFILLMLVIGFLLNFGWELIQYPLYIKTEGHKDHVVFCGLAAITDLLMVLLMYFGFALVFKDNFWIQKLSAARYSIVILTGTAGAILSELRHLSKGSWAYAESMPLVPVFNTGLVPVLQFMILPVIIFTLSHYLYKRISKN